ncbi:MAG TPA: hypothetical protein V6D15_12400 [Oculatellaceae cyanobacterium]
MRSDRASTNLSIRPFPKSDRFSKTMLIPVAQTQKSPINYPYIK